MSARFNRNDSNVPDDRLFPDDFIADQNGQDEDLLQIAKDFGCLPCIGEGLDVTAYNQTEHKVQIAPGWAYDSEGKRITVGEAQIVTLTDTSGGGNYIILDHSYATTTPRPAHRTGTSYNTRKSDSFSLSVVSSLPSNKVALANCRQTGAGAITVDIAQRLNITCKLVAQSMVPGISETPGAPQPPGSTPELPDLPKGRNIPMPIILHGTRAGSSWEGVETVLLEGFGRTTAAVNALTLERVNLKSGTPLADVKVWIGDWGQGQRDTTNLKKCSFTMPTQSGCTAWVDDLWIQSPPGYYYLVKSDESWFSKITDSGSNYVVCEDNLPDASTAEYFVCPYAEKYRLEASPFETDEIIHAAYGMNYVDYGIRHSPTSPVVTAKGLNVGGKYRLKVASMISGENFTKWAEHDFIVGQDLIFCWQTETSYLAATPVDGGVEVAIPQPTGAKAPEAYEICYTYGKEAATVPEPSFDDPTHATFRTAEQVAKLDIPPGNVVKVAARALRHRIVMRCAGVDRVIKPDYTAHGQIFAGGVSRLRNRKAFTNPIIESDVGTTEEETADVQKLPNPIWVDSIALFNPTNAPQTNFEVYVHGASQDYTSGRKIQIGGSGDETTVGARGWVSKPIADFRITDSAMAISIISTSGEQDFNLRYTVEYHEDSE
ncbi:hypothetical protein GX441_10380 [bacterium]|nr:hypothetical protein [bacterium]